MMLRWLACAFLPLLLMACAAAPPTVPVEQLIAGDLPEAALSDQYVARLTALQGDRAAFEADLKAAGFEPVYDTKHVTWWEYPAGKDNIWAFVKANHQDNADEVLQMQLGIARGPIPYG